MSVLENPNLVVYVDGSFAEFSDVITKSVVAYADSNGGKDLLLGASSNMNLEAVEGINMYVKDSGEGLKLFSTHWDGAVRTDKLVASVYDVAACNTTIVKAGSSNSVALVPSDALQTVDIGATTLYSSNGSTYLETGNSNGFVFNAPVSMTLKPTSNLVATDHVFAQSVSTFKSTGLSNLGDVKEGGFTFRLNSNLQLELIKYAKIVTADGDKKIYKKLATFGGMDITSNMTTDGGLTGFDPFLERAIIFDPNAAEPVPGVGPTWPSTGDIFATGQSFSVNGGAASVSTTYGIVWSFRSLLAFAGTSLFDGNTGSYSYSDGMYGREQERVSTTNVPPDQYYAASNQPADEYWVMYYNASNLPYLVRLSTGGYTYIGSLDPAVTPASTPIVTSTDGTLYGNFLQFRPMYNGLPCAAVLRKFRMLTDNGVFEMYCVGSTNGTDWTVLYKGVYPTGVTTLTTFNFTKVGAYTWYRWIVTKASGLFRIYEFMPLFA